MTEFTPGREYVWGNLASSSTAPVYSYIGADGDKYVFRKNNSEYIALSSTTGLMPRPEPEEPEPFFEEGKTYRRTNESGRFVRFRVTQVETTLDSYGEEAGPIAFGNITFEGLGGSYWEVKTAWTWRNFDWEEVA